MQKRTKVVNLRLTPTEAKVLRSLSKRMRISMSEFLRSSIYHQQRIIAQSVSKPREFRGSGVFECP